MDNILDYWNLVASPRETDPAYGPKPGWVVSKRGMLSTSEIFRLLKETDRYLAEQAYVLGRAILPQPNNPHLSVKKEKEVVVFEHSSGAIVYCYL